MLTFLFESNFVMRNIWSICPIKFILACKLAKPLVGQQSGNYQEPMCTHMKACPYEFFQLKNNMYNEKVISS